MPGLGSGACGEGACGLDVHTPGEMREVTRPTALAFDGIKRDFKLDANGLYEAEHPVDARVFALCRIAANSIRSARDVGQTVAQIQYIDQRTVRAQVEDRVRAAVEPMVAAGDIEIVSIDIDTTIRGRIAWRLNYRNLRTRKQRFATG